MSELPRGWAWATLGEIGEEVRESVVPAKDVEYDLYSVPAFATGASEVVRGSAIGSAKRAVCPDDVLLCKINPRINRVWIVNQSNGRPQIASPEYLIFRTGEPDLARYLCWYFTSPSFREWIKLSVEGATGSHTRAKSGPILRQSVPVPPLEEQRRIVAAIEKLLSSLDAAEQSLRLAEGKLNRFHERALEETLDGEWPATTLGALAQVITKGTTPTSIGFGFSGSGVLFVKAESIVNGLVDHSRCAHVSQEADEAQSRSQLAEDDILITIAGTLGRVGRVRSVDLPANTNQAVSLTRLKNRSLSRYLIAWLHGPVAQRYLRTAGRGVGLQNLNLKQIAETPVLLPSAAEQRRIVSEIERQLSFVNGLRVGISRAQRRSAALRRAILSCAFRGELVSQNPDEEPASALLKRIAAERVGAPKPARKRRARTAA